MPWMRITVQPDEFLGLHEVLHQWVERNLFTPAVASALQRPGSTEGIFLSDPPPARGKTGSAWFSPEFAAAAADLIRKYNGVESAPPRRDEVAVVSAAGGAMAALE